MFGLGDQCVEVFGPPGLHLVQFYSEVHGLGGTNTLNYLDLGVYFRDRPTAVTADPANTLECMCRTGDVSD